MHEAKPPLSHVFPWHAQGRAPEQHKSILRWRSCVWDHW